MKSIVVTLRHRLYRRRFISKYPKYAFQKDISDNLLYGKWIHPRFRRFLKTLLKLLDWIIEKRDKNDQINRRILDSIGVDPETDITSLDAFYKREFRKKKYMYFFRAGVTKDLPEPVPCLLEYMPKVEKKDRSSLFKNSLARFFKEGEGTAESQSH